jgi:N-acetylmuramoyl-L-alanine amidase
VPASDDASVEVARKRDPGPLFPWARVLAATGLRRIP